jgi:hypothetical protein
VELLLGLYGSSGNRPLLPQGLSSVAVLQAGHDASSPISTMYRNYMCNTTHTVRVPRLAGPNWTEVSPMGI